MFDGISVVPEKSDGGSDGSQKASADGRDAGIVPEVSRGDKIYSIGLLVNGVDKDHLMKHAQTAVDVAAKHDLIISQIAAVGLIQPGKKNVVNAAPLFNSPLAFSVIALDGHFFPLLKMPDDFPVTRSPTWVINTAKGSILIEGLENIDKMINQYGEYVDKDFASMMAEEVEVKGPERVEIVGIEEK
ncbi:MAG: hypothetical protein KDD64_16355 [Bdellovibrionales bacterium]|nr:hypothetical protein [Bdellovibrionales bacterium]